MHKANYNARETKTNMVPDNVVYIIHYRCDHHTKDIKKLEGTVE